MREIGHMHNLMIGLQRRLDVPGVLRSRIVAIFVIWVPPLPSRININIDGMFLGSSGLIAAWGSLEGQPMSVESAFETELWVVVHVVDRVVHLHCLQFG